MKEEGQIEPALVRWKDGFYELIFGERRWRAAQLAGLTYLEARVITPVSEAEAAAKGLIENLQRENLNPIEEAAGFKELNELDPAYWTQAKIDELTGKGQTYISESIRLLRLPPEILQDITRVILTRSHGELLLGLPTPELQKEMAEKMKQNSWNVRESERQIELLMKEHGIEKPKKAKKAPAEGFQFKSDGDRLIVSGHVQIPQGQDPVQALTDQFKDACTRWAASQKPEPETGS